MIIRIEGYQRPPEELAKLEARWKMVCPDVEPELESFAASVNGEIYPWVSGFPGKAITWSREPLNYSLALTTDRMKIPRYLFIAAMVAHTDHERTEQRFINLPEFSLSGPVERRELRDALALYKPALELARLTLLGQCNGFAVNRRPIPTPS